MRRRSVAAALASFAALAAFAAPALADVRFEGRTGQDRRALVVAEDDGVPKRVLIGWEARCTRPRFSVRDATVFRGPFDLSTRRRFRDRGSYRVRDQGGERITFTVRVSGRKVSPRRWIGRFRGNAVVRRGGEVRDRCSVRGIRWRAVR
ncbi:MAG TPA: hypothetical protein VG126_11865 [Thermoleophilaceae bacterium]|nr:hypothetical protein [Thermoleophilaceae bacterium]